MVGAFDANVSLILEAYEKACRAGARFLMTPELGVCGYPPHDLLDRPEMIERNDRAIAALARKTQGKSCALLAGHVSANARATGRRARNTVSVIENGSVAFSQSKTLLPTYDVFDEARYFEPAEKIETWDCDGTRIALALCEDLWGRDNYLGRRVHVRDTLPEYRASAAEVLLSLSASPYLWGKRERRERLHAEIARSLGVPLIYVNQVGGTDEVLFDGASFACDASGALVGRLPVFETAFAVVDVTGPSVTRVEGPLSGEAPEEIEALARGLVAGIREYFVRTGFKSAVLGLSGGIDSALVACLAAKALGPRNVLGVAMPSQHSSPGSLADAEALARNLGIRFEVRPIKFAYSTLRRELGEARGGTLAPLADENLQARIRGLTLMTYANHEGALALATGNKSELATGYCTLYGDMVGALAPIGDLFKMRVYELARHVNRAWGNPIPESSLTKAPSAELRPDQKDEDTLPPYSVLDPLLEDYIERSLPVDELEKKHARAKGAPSKEWVRETLRRVELSEYKRRQAAPVLKVTEKAFGIGRRVPIAKTWDQ